MKNVTPEQQKQSMDGWMKWMNANKASLVDHGGPLGKNRRVNASGAKDTKNEPGGYSVVQAEAGRCGQDIRQGPSAPAMAGGMDRDHGDHAGAGDVRRAVRSPHGAKRNGGCARRCRCRISLRSIRATCSCPPFVYRGFRNVGTTDAVQLTVITGVTEGRDDVSMPDSIAQQVRREHGESVLDAFKTVFKFDQPRVG
jgi:hypothetical protein